MENDKKKKVIIYVKKPKEERAIERIKAVVEEEGLKNLDISILANWSPSKTSKIFRGAQKPRMEDVQDLSYALGSDPEVFLSEKMNNIEFDRGRSFQNLNQIIKELQQPTKCKDLSVLIRRDFPYVMCKTAGVKMTRFVKFGNLNEVVDVFSNNSHYKPEAYIYDRKCRFKDTLVPVVGYWVSADYKHLILALCIFTQNRIYEMDGISHECRENYKGILDISDSETDGFTTFMRENKKRFPRRLQEGEIASVIYNLQDECFDEKRIEKDFRDMISLYARLIEEVTGIAPNFGIDINRYITKQFDMEMLIESAGKSVAISCFEMAKKNADYKCFFYEEQGMHETFQGENGKPYVETHLIIPIEAAPDFGENIFKEDNVVCLCPMCSAKIKNACNDIRSDMIWSIYQRRKEKLRSVGIEVTPGRLFELWNIK